MPATLFTPLRWRSRLFITLVATLCVVSAKAELKTENPARLVSDNLFEVAFVGESDGWITGYHGTVLHSVDAGASWTHSQVSGNELIRRGSFPDADHAWLVGHKGSIFHSADRGRTWRTQHQETGIYLRDISFVDARTGWAVGHEGRILSTRDGGTTWARQNLKDWTKRDLPRISGVFAIDENSAVATGEFGLVAHTLDSGATWSFLRLEGDPTMTAISPDGKGGFIAVGLDGVVASVQVDQDGSLHAAKLPLDIPTHLLNVRATQAGLLASGFGVVVRCTDQCVVMPADEELPTQYLWFGGAALAQDGSIWAVGLGGTVARAPSPDAPLELAFVLGGEHSDNWVSMGTSQ